MADALWRGLDSAATLVGNVRSLEGWIARINGTADDGNRYTFAGVSLRPCSVEVVVGEVFL